ncbi:MAG: dehydrogenase [Saprospiraceae bacterium]|nr:dehydrogenase [Saprospiraceae bacterium]HRG68074.1 dehydrogenase [Saprospiraceae bacterium]
MIFRSKAPFRLGLAGGGTDVSPYSELYGGAVLNATISQFAHATIEPIAEKQIIFHSIDQKLEMKFPSGTLLEPIPGFNLQCGIYNRLFKENRIPDYGFKLTTSMDVPAGSGLGTSSTLVVAILKVYSEMLNIPYGDYDLAHLAFDIERKDLNLAGGKQDQYAATFGGFNFMEFYEDDNVIVNPLRIKTEYLHELENNLLLYFTLTNRESSDIIKEQQKNVINNNVDSIEAMHQLKEQSKRMKDALLQGKLGVIGEILDFGFHQKRKMASLISNPYIDEIYDAARNAGAAGGKISGAGGGGFMFFYCPDNKRYAVMDTLQKYKGYFLNFQFTKHGVQSWRLN